MKIEKILFLSICLVFVADVSIAQQGSGAVRPELRNVNLNASNTRATINNEIRNEIKDLRASSTIEKQQLQDELKKRTEESRNEFMQKRNEANKEIQMVREEFKKRAEDEKLKLKSTLTVKRLELKEKLKIIKDERKQQIALNITDQFQQINTKVLENLSNILTKEELILQKISSRTDAISIDNNADVSAIKEGILNANKALVNAREAIIAQTGKVYVFDVKTESTIKSDIGTTKQLLEKDLNYVRSIVKLAHESIKKVAGVFEKNPNAQKLKVLQTATSTK